MVSFQAWPIRPVSQPFPARTDGCAPVSPPPVVADPRFRRLCPVSSRVGSNVEGRSTRSRGPGVDPPRRPPRRGGWLGPRRGPAKAFGQDDASGMRSVMCFVPFGQPWTCDAQQSILG